MSFQPLVTFKAGRCEFDSSSNPPKITADPTPGYLYFYQDEDIMHFCWRPRSAQADQPEVELFMVPGDASFQPYTGKDTISPGSDYISPTTGRIAVLKFQSSGDRHLFWLQSKTQHPEGQLNWFSQRDLKLIKIIDLSLSGQEVQESDLDEPITFDQSPRRDDDGDEDMGDAEPDLERQESTGGAGPGATGGDFRQEGEEAREGGADGARAPGAAPNDPSAIVQNFLNSLKGGNFGSSQTRQQQENLFTTLSDLLSSDNTIPVLQSADSGLVDALLSHLPPTLLLLSQEADDSSESAEPSPEAAQAAIQALSAEQKREILARVLRSPQLSQSLGSLTVALRDGGLPSVSEALKIPVKNGGLVEGGAVPLGGGDAVEAFLEGVKKQAAEEGKEDEGEGMDTS